MTVTGVAGSGSDQYWVYWEYWELGRARNGLTGSGEGQLLGIMGAGSVMYWELGVLLYWEYWGRGMVLLEPRVTDTGSTGSGSCRYTGNTGA